VCQAPLPLAAAAPVVCEGWPISEIAMPSRTCADSPMTWWRVCCHTSVRLARLISLTVFMILLLVAC
jgi:hypothetical protein